MKLNNGALNYSLRKKDRHTEGEAKRSVLPGQFEVIRVHESNDSQYFPGTFVVSRRISSDFPLDAIFQLEIRLVPGGHSVLTRVRSAM